MIKDRILGHGLIPRGYGLAPRKEPLEIDWNFLNILLNNGSFKIQALVPDKKEFVDITIGNAKKMYELLSKKRTEVKEVIKVEPKVVQPVKVQPVVVKEEPIIVEEPIKVEEVVQVEEVLPVEEVKVEETFKPVEEERSYFDKRNKFDKKKNKYRHQEEVIESKEE